jgi:hypothetical protein
MREQSGKCGGAKQLHVSIIALVIRVAHFQRQVILRGVLGKKGFQIRQGAEINMHGNESLSRLPLKHVRPLRCMAKRPARCGMLPNSSRRPKNQHIDLVRYNSEGSVFSILIRSFCKGALP